MHSTTILQLSIILLLFTMAYPRTVEINSTNLHDYITDQQWEQSVHSVLDSQQGKVTQLILINIIISKTGFDRLFQEDLSALTSFNITKVTLTQDIMDTLWQNQAIYTQLQSLVLDQCNLQSIDFRSLPQRQWPTLRKLSLANNFITQQGFQYISRLKLNLTYLDLMHNSLISNKSVSSVISLGLSHLQQLNIGQTSISPSNMLNILHATDPQRLTNLTIRYHTYPASFFQEFSKIEFPNLKKLDVWGMLIDQKAFPYLNNMRFPSLELLNFHQNEYESEQGISFFTKQRFPKLNRLDINLNFFDSRLITHLRKENFIFKELRCRILNMNQLALDQLSKMDFSQIQKLYLETMDVDPQSIQRFIRNAEMPVIEDLSFWLTENVGDIFASLCQKQWPFLKYLILPSVGSFDSNVLNKTNIFPSLIEAQINIQGVQEEKVLDFLYAFQNMAPKLEKLVVQSFQPLILLHEIYFGTMFTHTLNSNFTLSIKTDETNIPIKLSTNQKPKILHFSSFKALGDIQISFATFQNHTIDTPDQLSKNSILFTEEVKKNLDFSQPTQLVQDNSLQYLNWYKQNINKQCVLKSVRQLYVSGIKEGDLKILDNCTFPNLKRLVLNFDAISPQKEKQQEILFNISTYKYVEDLFLSGKMVSSRLIQTFKKNQFSHLRILNLHTMNLKSTDMEQILDSSIQMKRIKGLGLEQNNFKDGISFLRDLKLQKIDLSQNLLGSRTEELCAINYEFINFISFSQMDIGDNDMVNFVNCLKEEQKGGLPRVTLLDLSHNKIQIDGVEQLMNSGVLSLIQTVLLDQNNDPNLFNSIIGSPVAKRITGFQSISNYLTSIDPNLNPKHTKRIIQLIIKSDTLRDTDFQALNRLQFDSVMKSGFFLQKIQKCSTLMAIKNISSSTDLIATLSTEQIKNLNSTCLKSSSPDQNAHIRPSTVQIIGSWPYSQFRYFSDAFLNKNQQLKVLYLDGTYVSGQKIQQMADFSHLQKLDGLILPNNNLTDADIKGIFKQSMPVLSTISLEMNPITAEALQFFPNQTFRSLQYLQLSRTYIGDDGIAQISQAFFPKLNFLAICDIDITGKGLKLLQNIKAPLLQMIDLSCNDLTVNDLINFNISKLPNLKVLIIYPTMLSDDLNRLLVKFNRFRDVQALGQIQIITDLFYLSDQIPEEPKDTRQSQKDGTLRNGLRDNKKKRKMI